MSIPCSAWLRCRARLLPVVLLCTSAALLPVHLAHAQVKEPNGVAVPLASGGKEIQVSALFTQRMEMIDYVADGLPTPDTFSPLCGFKATLVLKQSGSKLAVGWYNADPARVAPPAASEIFQLVPAGSPVGTSITGADIRKDPNYKGGPIGFALIRPNSTPAFNFSEARYNVVCNNALFCPTPAPWFLSVSYKSKLTPNAYYVAFEDGDTTASGWSNDGDFNDYVFLFEGLSCVGEGASCAVPDAKGLCIAGILECSAGGALVCKGVNAKTAESCDGQDNDCNDLIDDGNALCGTDKVCSRGQCVPRCGTGEFRCAVTPFTQCEHGLCVDPACAGKTCAAGQACIGGACRAPCDGVVCPGTQACRLGACVDPCHGVTCDSEHVCSGGGCILRCDCAGCAQNLACDSSGLCVDMQCAGKQCSAGTVCKQGQCVDVCKSASCPIGSSCKQGACVVADGDVSMSQPTDAGAGAALATTGDAALVGAADGGGLGGDGGLGSASASTRKRAAAPAGCECHVASSTSAPNAWLLAVLGLGVPLLRGRHGARTRH